MLDGMKLRHGEGVIPFGVTLNYLVGVKLHGLSEICMTFKF